MVIEDVRDWIYRQNMAVQRPVESEAWGDGVRTESIAEFLASCEKPEFRMTLDQKRLILDQAKLVIEQFYAHLPFKRARYAIDPLQGLRLIGAQLQRLSQVEFHRAVLDVFVNLRDAHTFYGLPEPFNSTFAFLPFSVGSYEDGSGRHFVVTSVIPQFEHEHFRRCAEITAWNGMPVARAIERQADLAPGANAGARFQRGLGRLTLVSLKHSMPPDEHSVTIEYIAPDDASATRRGLVFPWYVATGMPSWNQVAGLATSMCDAQQARSQCNRYLAGYAPASVTYAPNDVSSPGNSRLPDAFEYQRTGGGPGAVDPSFLTDGKHPEKRFGYIQIKTFNFDPQDFVDEFRRILDEEMEPSAPDGLIVDVRSNPGGVIEAGERILQLLTPGTIQPMQFHFINTRLTQKVFSHADLLPVVARGEWQNWVAGSADAVASGSEITVGQPLTAPDLANGIGQRYHGPVVLIIDALSYSATDIFSAGFQDNGVGPIIGVDASTGGGGASRWLHTELQANVQDIPETGVATLPMGSAMALASRRSIRVGRNAGVALEDAGVGRDIAYSTTRDDLLYGDRDLLRFACEQLSAMPSYVLQVISATATDAGVRVELRTGNLSRIEFLLDQHPQAACAAAEHVELVVPKDGLPSAPKRLQVRGYTSIEDEDLGTVSLHLAASASVRLAKAASSTAQS